METKKSTTRRFESQERAVRTKWCLVENQHGGGDHGGPETTLVAHGRLRHVGGTHDLVREAIDLLLLVPGAVGIELHVERSGQHFGREFFGVLAGSVFGLTEGMVLAE